VSFSPFSASGVLDWNKADNYMRGLIANDGNSLTVQWNWGAYGANQELTLVHMALGETIGFANQVSQNGLTRSHEATISRDLLGDPTLRIHTVKPPTNVRIEGGTLKWDPPIGQTVLEYRVYHATDFANEFTRIPTQSPIIGDSLSLSGYDTGDIYMVRAVVLETTPSGSYYNASQGAFSQSL
jgi:hypothetical protein